MNKLFRLLNSYRQVRAEIYMEDEKTVVVKFFIGHRLIGAGRNAVAWYAIIDAVDNARENL